jgi:O-succinylbenzoate synthase
MKISSYPYRVKFAEPFRTAKGEYRERAGYLISCEDNQGLCGWGEVAPFPGLSNETDAEVRAGLLVASALLMRFPAPTTPEQLSEVLFELDTTLETMPPSVRFGVELAILSYCEKGIGLPLPAMLGDEEGWRLVPVNGIVDPDSPLFEERIADLRSRGVSCFKVKLLPGSRTERTERLEKLRSQLSVHETYRIDCNQMLTAEDALELVYRLGTQNLEYLEDPLSPDRLKELEHLSDKLPVPVALDESLMLLDLGSFIPRRARKHVFVLKPTVLGGIRRTVRLGKSIIQNGGKVVVTSTLEWSHGLRGVYVVASSLAGHNLLPSGLLTNDLFVPEGARYSFEQGAIIGIEVGDGPPQEGKGVSRRDVGAKEETLREATDKDGKVGEQDRGSGKKRQVDKKGVS